MATFTFFHEFKNNLANGLIDLDSDTFKVALVAAANAPVAADDDLMGDITQIAGTGGYTTGGQTLANVTWLETGSGTGVWQFTSDNAVFTATSGGIPTFRYVVLYDDTATGDPLVGFLDYGGNVSVTDGNAFTVDVGANGYFQLS